MNLIFQRVTELIGVQIAGNTLRFMKWGASPIYATIEGLKLNLASILKEFPDLEGKPTGEIKRTAIERFKKHFKSLKTTKEKVEYIIKELEPHGWILKKIEQAGFRDPRMLKRAFGIDVKKYIK